MNQNSPSFFRPLGQGLQVYGKCFLKIAIFEIIYKAITAVLIRPLLSFILQFLLTVSGNKLAFNEQIFNFLLSFPGVLTLLILTGLSTVLVYFEFAVIISLVQQTERGKPADLALAVTVALWSFKSLRHPSTLLFSLYSLVILPFINIGVTSSLIPDLSIPNHITGELYKSQSGELLLFFVTILVIIAFFWMIFVLPSMVTEHIPFHRACMKSFRTIKAYRLKMLGIIAVSAGAWLLLFFFPRYLSNSIFGVPTVTFLQALTQFGFSAKTPVALLLWLLIVLFAQVMLTPLILTILTYYYTQTGDPVSPDSNAISRISAKLYRTGTGSRAFASRTVIVVSSLLSSFWNNSFVRKYRVLISICFLGLFAFLVYQLFFTVYRVHDPIVVGHRGSAYAVENTLEAIDHAIEGGADYVEIDVQLSADGVPMVVHDTNLNRLAGDNVYVYNLTSAELQALTLTQKGQTGQIPTLEEVVEHCEGRILLAVELKPHGNESEDLVEQTMKELTQNEYQKGCMVFSQDYDLVTSLVENYPDYTIGYCVYGNLGKMSSSRLRQMGIDFLLVEEAMVSKSLINAGRKSFVAIYVWTVNDTAQMKTYLNMGVLGLITDYPDEAAKILQAMNILKLE